MPQPQLHSSFSFASITVQYWTDETGRLGLTMLPSARLKTVEAKRQYLEGIEIRSLPFPPMQATELAPLAHLKWADQPYPSGFAPGRSLGVALRVTLEAQEVLHLTDHTVVVTRLAGEGYGLSHHLVHRHGEEGVRIKTMLTNTGTAPRTVEHLSSVVLGGITPFDQADASGHLFVHRARSAWSAEGRFERHSLEDLHLERPWVPGGAAVERFGQVGTHPSKGFFPFVALEDSQARVFWGLQLAWAGSWQLELSRRNDGVEISGGLADREFGHWHKTMQPGEVLETPEAWLSVSEGDLDDLCHNLTRMQKTAADQAPTIEESLPIVANEYCSSWGNPTHQTMLELADCLRDTGVTYLVMDSGWYRDSGDWTQGLGDWEPSRVRFPDGLEATAQAIRECGLIPGIWFEPEVVAQSAQAFEQTEHLLKRDGATLTTGVRRFWDLNDLWVQDHLEQKLIGLLERCGFGYLKIDYNESLGMGCDGHESLGEGLRQQVLGSYRLFERLHEQLPDLVIENCASGGLRLEPSMLQRSSLGSSSDAHELLEIPILAANLQRLMLPQQSLIWATLRVDDTQQRMLYTLASGFLGRLCLSGDLTRLSKQQWQFVCELLALYQNVAPIIINGKSRRSGGVISSYRHPQGWQAVCRTSLDGQRLLLVAHSFAMAPQTIKIELHENNWHLERAITVDGALACSDNSLSWQTGGDFSACLAVFSRRDSGATP